MARRRRSEDARAGEDSVRVGFSVQISPDTPTYYFNHAEIAHLPHDFALLFARLPSKLTPDRLGEIKAGTLMLECELQVLLAPTMIPKLIEALTIQRRRYEEQWGPIPDLETMNAQ